MIARFDGDGGAYQQLWSGSPAICALTTETALHESSIVQRKRRIFCRRCCLPSILIGTSTIARKPFTPWIHAILRYKFLNYLCRTK
jgi:hypothetical protein